MILNTFCSGNLLAIRLLNGAKENFSFVICAYGGHLGNGCNFGTINATCMLLVLIESSDDFEQFYPGMFPLSIHRISLA